MDPTTLKAWRKAERERLIAARAALAPSVWAAMQHKAATRLRKSLEIIN